MILAFSSPTARDGGFLLKVISGDWGQLSHVQLFVTPGTAACQASCPSPSSTVCSNSCPLSRWCHPTISSSVTSFSSCSQFFPASGYFPMSWLFASGSQSIGASASDLPVNFQNWFPLGLTDLIFSLSMGLSRVFCSTTVGKHQSWHLYIYIYIYISAS